MTYPYWSCTVCKTNYKQHKDRRTTSRSMAVSWNSVHDLCADTCSVGRDYVYNLVRQLIT